MENSLEYYKSWILNTARNKKMIISQLSWPNRFGIEIKDYIVQFEANGEKYVGHGSDMNSDLAILKATSEAFERYCVKLLKLRNSNGCAVHLTSSLAKEKALLELVERDCFLVNFINGFSFEKIESGLSPIISDKNYHLTNYCLAAGTIKVILTRLEINRSANILGLSASFNMKDALVQSQIEALRQLMYVTDKNLVSQVNYDEINKKDCFSFDDHGDIALTPEHYNEIEFIFDQARLHERGDFSYFDQSSTYYEEYEIPLNKENPFFGIPLFFVKALNHGAQELFVGRTIDNINPLRIVNNGNLNLCLHPFR